MRPIETLDERLCDATIRAPLLVMHLSRTASRSRGGSLCVEMFGERKGRKDEDY